jgi:hypothetical protein
MRSNPIESAPGNLYQQREINWGFANLAEMHSSPPRGGQRFGINAAALFVTAGLAMMFVPSVLPNWTGQWQTEVSPQRSSQDAANSPDSAIKHQLAAEQERQRGEVLAHQLALAREDLGTLTARVTALTDAQTEAERTLQTARASEAEQKLALEQERQRGDALVRELASAREEVEARKVAASAADASAKNAQASAAEQKHAAEQERQRGEVLAHEVASARVDVETLTGRVTALTEERSDAEKALQTAQASAAEQKLALEQERQRSVLFRDLASAREDVEVRKASANAADASAKYSHNSVRTVSAGGSKDIETGPGSLTPVSKSPVLPAPQKSELGRPNPPGTVSAARSDDGLAQVPERARPVSRRSGQRASEANGQPLRALPRENPPQRMTGREHRETPRSNYSSIRLFGD